MERPSLQALAFASGFLHQEGSPAGLRVAGLLAREAKLDVEGLPKETPSATERLWAAAVLRKRVQERPASGPSMLPVAAFLETPGGLS